MMVSNSVSGEYWSHLCSNFSKTWAESLSLQHFTSQTHRERSCCVTGTGQYLWVMEDHSHDWTPLRCLIARRRISVPAFPSCGLRSRSSCSIFSDLRVSKSCSLWPHSDKTPGFGEVGERCCNLHYGREDTAGHSAPAQSSSFCNQLPECCAS